MKRENSFSQLNMFKESKNEISKIYQEISNYVTESSAFFHDIFSSDALFQSLIQQNCVSLLNNYVDKTRGIQSVINRNNMKCAFFGRTSNGKSSTINAMLGSRILPAGIGHTTSCFLEIQGTDGAQGYMTVARPSLSSTDQTDPSVITSDDQSNNIPDSNDDNDDGHGRITIESVGELARDVCSNKLSTNSLIKLYWPSDKCPLLSQDVVVLDSPGIDVDPDIDRWIDLYCLDADVFVLVANSEATLNHTEKAFFHKVKDKLSKPNIFILNNRWDASADQIEYVKEAREQHLDRCVSFLTKELKVCSKSEAESRVYFVSASEALSLRSRKNESGSGEPSGCPVAESPGSVRLREGWQSRLFEFTNFEKNLEKTLSESATKTKFASHSSQGLEIVSEVRTIVESLNEKAQEQKEAAVNLTHRMRVRNDKLDSTRKMAHKESLTEIARLSEKVAERVADVLREEMRRLGDVVDEFDHAFYEEPGLLAKYKTELSQHVERQLGSNLTSMCARDLRGQVTAVTTAILKRYSALVPDKDLAEKMRQSVCDDYAPRFYIDCNNISSDFREDLTFRFSLGPTAVLGKLIGATGPGAPRTKSIIEQCTGSDSLFSALALRRLLPSVTGRSVLVAVVCGGLLVKATGWKVLGVCAGIYGAMYAYEYSTWTVRAKEKSFKAQFRTHVTEKLELIMALTSKHSAEQPQYSLKTTLKRLDGIVDNHMEKMKTDIDKFEKDIKKLEDIVSNSKSMKNKAIYLERLLKDFHEKYIVS